MAIKYLTGDATRPVGDGPRLIVHCVNDVGQWGRGFVLALSARYPQAEKSYRQWAKADDLQLPFELGQVQFVEVGNKLWVANLIGQHGIAGRGISVPPIRYEALQQVLTRVAEFALAQSASVHMPRLGAGLAGGRWELIEPIVVTELVGCGVAVTVYDLPS